MKYTPPQYTTSKQALHNESQWRTRGPLPPQDDEWTTGAIKYNRVLSGEKVSLIDFEPRN